MKINFNKIESDIAIHLASILEEKQKLKNYFDNRLIELFNEDYNGFKLVHIDMGLNNHEFNDGDETYFSVYYDDLTLTFNSPESEHGVAELLVIGNYNESRENLSLEAVHADVVKLFRTFDVDTFYNDLFGEYNESLTFSYDSKKSKIVIE